MGDWTIAGGPVEIGDDEKLPFTRTRSTLPVSSELQAKVDAAAQHFADTVAPLLGYVSNKYPLHIDMTLVRKNGKVRVQQFVIREE